MPRPLRWLFLVVLAVLVVLGPIWWARARLAFPGRCAVGYAPDLIAVDPPPLRAAIDAAPTFRDAIAGRYELRPDRRFLLAIVLSDCLITGEAPTELSGAYDGGRWRLAYGGRDIGSLRSLPDFGDAMELISSRARELATASDFRLSDQPDAPELDSLRMLVEAMQPFQVVAALERVDDLWRRGGGTKSLLELAARGLVALTVATDDPLELTDPLAGRATATLAVAQAVGGSGLAKEEALLALKMGYDGHASRVVSTFPAEDPVRLFVLHDTLSLRRLAEEPDATPLTRRLSSYGFGPTLEEEGDSLSDEGGGLIDAPLMPLNFRLTVQVVEAVLGELGLTASDGAPAFEQRLIQHTAPLKGPFLDAGTYAAYLSAGYYSEVYEEASRHLRCGCLDDDEALERSLGGVTEGPGAELDRWYMDMQVTDSDELEADLSRLPLVGGRARAKTLDRLRQSLAWVDVPRQLRATQALAAQLDSRVDHQYLFGSLAAGRLMDPVTAERLYARVTELAGWTSPWRRAWLAFYQGDDEALAALLLDEEASLGARRYALELASRRQALPDERIREGAQLLIAEAPLDWDVRHTFLDYLEAQGDIDEAIDILSDWLESTDASGVADVVQAATTMARLLQARGDPDAAYEWIRPLISRGGSAAIGRAALIQVQRGADREGLSLAEMAVARSPRSAWPRSVLTEVLWRLDRPEDAATVVGDAYAASQLDPVAWSEELAGAFVEAFEGRPVEDAVGAFALVAARNVPPPLLFRFIDGLHERGRTDLAFELTSRFAPPQPMQGFLWLVSAYGYLAELQGPAAAMRWYREVAPPVDDEMSSMLMFNEGQSDLLWTAIDDAAPPSAFAWLMRAAAWLRYGGSAEQRGLLSSHFAEESDDPYHRVGRFLMGIDDEEEVLSIVSDRRRLGEVAYYVGLKAEVEGRFADAADWYQVVVDTGLVNLGEYRWALDALSAWAGETQTVTSLKRAAGAS